MHRIVTRNRWAGCPHGTSLSGPGPIGSRKFLAAAPLALVRGFVHQTAGGEVTFWEARYEATLNFFEGRWI